MGIHSWRWRRIALVWLGWLLTLALGLLGLPHILSALAPGPVAPWRVYSHDFPAGWPDPLAVLGWILVLGPLVLLVLIRLWPRR